VKTRVNRSDFFEKLGFQDKIKVLCDNNSVKICVNSSGRVFEKLGFQDKIFSKETFFLFLAKF